MFVSKRPEKKNCQFVSESVERKIREVKALIADDELAWLFENCFPNTLDTTVDYDVVNGKPDTFVITGDIDAMWLRDSTAQVWPYLPLIKEDEPLKDLVKGLIFRQIKCVLLDPYANAFYKDGDKVSEHVEDKPKMLPGIHERKWEIDSLCYVIRLANEYFSITGDNSIFDKDWDKAMQLILKTFKVEQRKDGSSPYWFSRKTSQATGIAPHDGEGQPIRPVGLICSVFRPSDDATVFPFLIPSNIFAYQSMRQVSQIYLEVLGDESFSKECRIFADEVEVAVNKFAIFDHAGFGKIYAFEVDGFGNRIYMDDANVPSLISLAYLGVHQLDDEVYENTRKFVLSSSNPFYQEGEAAIGIGGPHTGKEKIWPMGIILQALTSDDDDEIKTCLGYLKNTHADTGFMHEAFNKDDASKFSRTWFAWANTLFGELIIKIATERPSLLKQL